MSDRPMDRSQPLSEQPFLFGRPVQWTLGFMSGLLRSVLMTREQRRQQSLERWTNQWFSQVRSLMRDGMPPAEHPGPAAMMTLRRTLVGRSRGYVVSMLGSPPATSIPATPEIEAPHPAGKWTAEVWYYPMDRRHREGVAVTFENDRVSRVDRMSGPK